jgi:hypothetical protein
MPEAEKDFAPFTGRIVIGFYSVACLVAPEN